MKLRVQKDHGVRGRLENLGSSAPESAVTRPSPRQSRPRPVPRAGKGRGRRARRPRPRDRAAPAILASGAPPAAAPPSGCGGRGTAPPRPARRRGGPSPAPPVPVPHLGPACCWRGPAPALSHRPAWGPRRHLVPYAPCGLVDSPSMKPRALLRRRLRAFPAETAGCPVATTAAAPVSVTASSCGLGRPSCRSEGIGKTPSGVTAPERFSAARDHSGRVRNRPGCPGLESLRRLAPRSFI